MRFLLDENIHWGLLSHLKKLGHDAATSPKGLVNGDVLSLAISEGRILLTHDADFAGKIPPPDCPGIILVKIFPRHFEELKKSLAELFVQKNSPELFANRLFILLDSHFDEIPFAPGKTG